MKVYTSTFYKSNISPYLLFYQKQVFKMLGIELHQICDNDITHGDFMNRILREEDADYFIFFDIDCIPLNPKVIKKVLDEVVNKKTISGCAQTANQYYNGENIYVGPCFFCISKEVYNLLGQPDLNEDREVKVDAGGILSKLAPNHNINLSFWYPTAIEEAKWKLYPDKMFGIGTTYEDSVYHLFESRYTANIAKFVRKSKTTINENWKLNPLKYLIIKSEILMFQIKNKF
ncbi:hypothetical protein [Formosa sp. L2A11]|uniref:hypothetical protein n=1 Tax=Formosa sp. L2A11 TaxID=2686363 RepID=UPI00131D031F|nr:hypothetical protein [Formosa sp. L2A11]